jgi:hypothetical protein
MQSPPKLLSLDDILTTLDSRRPSGAPAEGAVLSHCAESIECSLAGYPKLKPAWLRATVGRLVKRRFLARQAMKHDTAAGLPGLPPISGDVAPAAGLERLRTAISAFRRYDGSALAPHPVFGNCTKAEYDQLHAMHIVDHLGALARGTAN